MNEKIIIEKTLEGLRMTAIEKICVAGIEDAQEDLKRLRGVYEDLVMFWGLDEKLINEFDKKIGILG